MGRSLTPEEFDEIIIRTGDDSAMLRLKDVARIELGGKDYSVLSSYNNMVARMGAVYLLPGANAIATGDLVEAKLNEIATLRLMALPTPCWWTTTTSLSNPSMKW